MMNKQRVWKRMWISVCIAFGCWAIAMAGGMQSHAVKSGADPQTIGEVTQESTVADPLTKDETALSKIDTTPGTMSTSDCKESHVSAKSPSDPSTTLDAAQPKKSSNYTVDFAYDKLQYSIKGGTTVPLSDILQQIGISGIATGVQCSNPNLFSASKTSSGWMITSRKAFSTTEWMKVTVDGKVYDITVTDASDVEWDSTNNRYKISSYAGLREFADIVNGENSAANAILMKDIDCSASATNAWTPIGKDETHAYIGTFNGNGKVIRNLTFADDTADYVGLFGYVGQGGTVQNVGLEGGSITGKKYVGAVVGYNSGTVTNCYNTGTVTRDTTTDDKAQATFYVGGVVGENDGKVQNCYNKGSVTAKGKDAHLGGVVGWNTNRGEVIDCYNTGNVSIETGYKTNTNSYVGGVIGQNKGSTVTNCYNTGTVTGNLTGNLIKSRIYVGGVVGYNTEDKGKVTTCYNEGAVTGIQTGTGDPQNHPAVHVGGVVGYNTKNAEVTSCYNTGAVTGSGSYSATNVYVGGVGGYNSVTQNAGCGTITNCYNTGAVSATGTGTNVYVGGVAGFNSADGDNKAKVTNCYNTGAVSAEATGTNVCVGGVVGMNQGGTVTNCYNTGAVSATKTGTNVYVGGVAGVNQGGTVTNCYNTGAVSAKATVTGNNSATNVYVGGVVGYNSGTVQNCYYDKSMCSDVEGAINDSDDTTNNVKGLTTDVMTGVAALNYMTGFANNVWLIKKADDFYSYYPHLKGFNLDSSGKQMAADAIPQKEWPPRKLNNEVFMISSYADLKEFAQIVNGSHATIAQNSSACAILTADIDCSASSLLTDNPNYIAWTPIGNASNSYKGIFDGDGHTIMGLTFNGDSSVGGLFGYVGQGGTVRNVGLVGGSIQGKNYVGAVVGHNSGTVTNCYNTGAVSATGTNVYVGGVVGHNSGTVTNCYNTGAVSATGTNVYVGGVVGWNVDKTGRSASEAKVTNCYNTGAVSAKGTGTNVYVGGVVGYNSGTVQNCYYDKSMCSDVEGAINDSDDTTNNVKGLTTDLMTGTNALSNMTGFIDIVWISKDDGEDSGKYYWYYPHLKGFAYDTVSSAANWPPKVEVSVTGGNKVYDGQPASVGVTVVGGDPASLGEYYTVRYSDQEHINAGEYSATITFITKGHAEINKNFTISPVEPQYDTPKYPIDGTQDQSKQDQDLGGPKDIDGQELLGTWTWVEGEKLRAGKKKYQVTFTPDDTNYASITSDVVVSTWGAEVNNGSAGKTVINYVAKDGTTSAEVLAGGIIWLKEQSGGLSTWYGIDNSNGTFENGSRFWVRWLSKTDDPEEWEKYYDKLDVAHRELVKDNKLWIFLMGVTKPDGTEYTVAFGSEVDLYIQLDTDWKESDIKAVFISDAEDEDLSVRFIENYCLPDGTYARVAVVSLRHFSPYAVYGEVDDHGEPSKDKVDDRGESSNDDSVDTNNNLSDTGSGTESEMCKTSDTIPIQGLFGLELLMMLALMGLCFSLKRKRM